MFTPFYFVVSDGLDTFFWIRFEYGGTFTEPPHRRYEHGKVAYFDYVDTDVFSLHDLDDMFIELGYQKENTMCFMYCMPDHSLDNGLMHLGSDGDVRKFVSFIPTHRQLNVYVSDLMPLKVITDPLGPSSVSPEMVRRRRRSSGPGSCGKKLPMDEGHKRCQSQVNQVLQQSQITQLSQNNSHLSQNIQQYQIRFPFQHSTIPKNHFHTS